MTKDNMPDAVNVWKNGRLYCRDYNDTREPIHSHNAPIERYLRAEPVEALLRQARDALNAWDVDHSPPPDNWMDAHEAIGKFLGDSK